MGRARWSRACAALSLCAAVGAAHGTPAGAARFVGAAVCASCHAAQASAWQGSHHQLAMQPAAPGALLAPFEGETLNAGGVTSTFTRRGGRYVVRTEGADGRPHDYEVAGAIGVAPLQQYLVPMPDGSLHALPFAWDTRAAAQGGQRWFHLQAAHPPRPADELHWTGRQMNASFMCIECHTTGFRKNYDVATRRYASRWAEGNVGCEACHGAGSKHVEWARRLGDAPDKGLAILYDQRKGVRWEIQAATGNAVREPAAAATDKEADACARCHSHRSRIAEDAGPGAPLLDGFHPSAIEPGLYWNDGQMRAEVYNHVSFLQSRMHAKGVTCSDCHEPHSLKLRAPGNAVCFQCHAQARYDAPAHHFHRLGTAGAQCVACHMPATTYMSIDSRHDHFIRVPQPALSRALGSPDACTQCHRGKPQAWAVQWTDRWYPRLRERRSKMAEALQSLDREDWDVVRRIAAVLDDASQPASARASVLQRLPSRAPFSWPRASRALGDADPLVRRAAVDALRDAPPEVRLPQLAPMLDDPVRDVRIEAARWLASSRARLAPARQRAFDAALREYVAAQEFNADRPEAWDNLATLWADQGQWTRAEAALDRSLALAPDAAATRLNLADLYRAQGREAEAEALIRSVVRRDPQSAPAQLALGLSLLRQGKRAEGRAALRAAQQLDPGLVRSAMSPPR